MERVFYYISHDKIARYLEKNNWDLDKAMNECHQENVQTLVISEPRPSVELPIDMESKRKSMNFMSDFLRIKPKKEKEIPPLIKYVHLILIIISKYFETILYYFYFYV